MIEVSQSVRKTALGPEYDYQGCRNLAAAILHRAIVDTTAVVKAHGKKPTSMAERNRIRVEARTWIYSPASKELADLLGIDWPPSISRLEELREMALQGLLPGSWY